MDDKKPGHSGKNQSGSSRFGISFFLTLAIMFPCWLLVSGHFDPFHLSLGLISCLIISFFFSDLLFSSSSLKKIPIQWLRFIMYIPWLLYQIFVANIHVMYLVFHPGMMELIDPKIINFKSKLKSDMALTTLANSITLTPGTISVYVTDYGEFEVHVIDSQSGESLPGEMETRIAKIFEE